MKIEFFADGEPAPGGSKSAYALTDKAGKLIIKTNPQTGRERPVLLWSDDSKGNKAWRKLVGWRGKSAMQQSKQQPFAGPLLFSVEFLMPRGKTVKRQEHTIRPDLSKLIRSTEDALTGIAWVDDSQIIEHGTMRKRYVRPGERPGAKITVEELTGEQVLELELMPAAREATKPKPQPVTIDSPFD